MTNDINIAVPLYVGYEITTYPKEDGSRLIDKFGSEIGSQLESQIIQLFQELDALKPDWKVHSLQSAARWAVNELIRTHPELDAKSIEALEWLYSWWWK